MKTDTYIVQIEIEHSGRISRDKLTHALINILRESTAREAIKTGLDAVLYAKPTIPEGWTEDEEPYCFSWWLPEHLEEYPQL